MVSAAVVVSLLIIRFDAGINSMFDSSTWALSKLFSVRLKWRQRRSGSSGIRGRCSSLLSYNSDFRLCVGSSMLSSSAWLLGALNSARLNRWQHNLATVEEGATLLS